MTLPSLLGKPFQLGYVVNNVDDAMKAMGERFGVTQWKVLHLGDHAPGRALAFAYVQGTMIELVDVRRDRDTIYRDWIPDKVDELRLNHLGYLFDDEDAFRTAVSGYKAAGFATALEGVAGNLFEYYYADTVAALGHYTELMRYKSDEGRAMWADVPHN